MELLNVLDLVSVNEERTEADKALAQDAADEARALAIGAAILDGKTPDEAQAAGDAAAVRPGNNYRVWYELVPEEVYPATVAWLRENGHDLLTLSMNTSDAELITRALNGDKAAAFVLKCRQYAPANLLPLVDGWDSAWDLAEKPRGKFADGDTRLITREKALEAARLFVTEIIHQETGQAIGLHWAKSDIWKL